jgi:hypothetical protein
LDPAQHQLGPARRTGTGRMWPKRMASVIATVAAALATSIGTPVADATEASAGSAKPHFVRKDADRPGTYWYALSVHDRPPELRALTFLEKDAQGRHVFQPLWLAGMRYRCAVPCRRIELHQPDVDIVRRTFALDPDFFHAHLFEDAERGLLEALRPER